VQKIIKGIVQRAARIFRGPSYRLDPNIPITALIAFSLRRAMDIFRCILRGLALNPRKWFFVGSSVVLRNRRHICFGRGSSIGNFVVIDGLSVNGVMIGEKVSIGPYTIIEATGVISNLGVGCKIGANSGIGAFSFIGAAGGVKIGDNVIMGQYVSFHSENHCFEDTVPPIRMQGVTRQGIVIEDDCWIGAKVTFLDGSHVGKGSVIAAGAVVRGQIPPYSVAGGVPAKVIKSRKRRANA
jgi:acetyltransferase-like isoleucine patch superfamily enzyme